MKKVELKARFNSFYNSSYLRAMAWCMAQTGDFINGEDLLADAYYAVYKKFLKDKNGAFQDPEKYLFSMLEKDLEKYWKKHRKESEPAPGGEVDCEALLETELNLTEEAAVKQMLVQDVLEFVSAQPAVMRRAFAMYFYLDMTLEETAAALGISTEAVKRELSRLLQSIRDEFLEDYE